MCVCVSSDMSGRSPQSAGGALTTGNIMRLRCAPEPDSPEGAVHVEDDVDVPGGAIDNPERAVSAPVQLEKPAVGSGLSGAEADGAGGEPNREIAPEEDQLAAGPVTVRLTERLRGRSDGRCAPTSSEPSPSSHR